MNLNNKYLFSIIFVVVTFLGSVIAYSPAEIIILGPEFYDREYFEEELNIISEKMNIRIAYKTVTDPETYILDNPDSLASIAIIPNPQGVTNLADRGFVTSLNTIKVDNSSIYEIYSNHLNEIVSVEGDIYGAWFRLFPNSLLWYDISKLEEYENLNFQNFESLVIETKKIADGGISSWCANSESAASTGWIQTNWLEDIILSKYGPEIYDRWADLEIQASNFKIYSSIKVIDDLIFYPNHIHNGPDSIINLEFKNLPNVLLNDNNACFLSWSGHYFRYYIPEEFQFGIDYGVIKFPKIKENSIVGIGDNLVLLDNNQLSKDVLSEILSKQFGERWATYSDSEYISANKNFDKELIVNDLTSYEFQIVHESLENDLFRYDASEIMARPIGSNLLWKFFRDFIQQGSGSLVSLLNVLDKNI